jgi:hypothetical protein
MISTDPIIIGNTRYHVTVLNDEVMVARWTGRAWTVEAKGNWKDGRIVGCEALDMDVLGVLEAKVSAVLEPGGA